MPDEEKIEYEPDDEPILRHRDYRVYAYENADEIVPDVIVTHREGDEHFRLWGYQGHRGIAVLCIHTDHKHPPDYPDEGCSKWSIYGGDPFPSIAEAPPTPDEVMELVADVSDAPVIDKSRSGPAHDGEE